MKNFYLCGLTLCYLLTAAVVHGQVPLYNSYPSAPATVYLDFDGQYVTGTSWNMSGPLTLGPSNLSTAQMTEIFNRVSEDYRPFNINITTDSTKYWAAPALQRMRVILTITSDWYGSAGGVSYVNSFTWGDNTPAFVFTALLNYNTKNVAEAAAHEIGHTLGLKHQSSYNSSCVRTAEYNAGTGSGEIGWAPIMGVGYYRNFTLWNNGANPYGCTSYQDDLSIITSTTNNFGYRADDHSNNLGGSATQASFTNNQFTLNGVIEKVTDQDVFKFNMPAFGNFHLDALPFSTGAGNAGSNLDIQVELMTSSNNILGVYNPDNTLSASIDTVLDAGNYYLRIKGIGNIYAPDYASIGSYSLKAAYIPSSALPVHKLELHGRNDNKFHKLDWIVKADETITRQVVEVSVDGTNFQSLADVAKDATSFSYVPENGNMLSYRLHLYFDNGHEFYSNIVALKNNAIQARPSLSFNLVNQALKVNSPSPCRYSVYDYNGKLMMRGNLVQGLNNISTGQLGSGMYVIHFTDDQNQYVEKFMKQ